MKRLLAALILLAGATAAADLQPGDAPIPEAEWRAMTDGRTVWYSLNGMHWGKEYFHPGSDTATFVGVNGLCATAPWVHVDGLYCFSYTGLDCFRHVRRGEAILVLPVLGHATWRLYRRMIVHP